MNLKPTLLVISPTYPYPLISGGKLRIFNLLKELSSQFDITLLTLAEDNDDSSKNRQALVFLKELITIPISQKKQAQVFRLLKYSISWLMGTPAEVLVKRTPQMATNLSELLSNQSFDYIQFEYIQNAQYLGACKTADAPKYMVAHDISYISQQRKAEVAKGLKSWFWSREAKLMKRYEMDNWPKFDAVFTMSETDQSHLKNLVPSSNVKVIPNGVDTKNLAMSSEATTPPKLIFVGWMRHLPNCDAIEWFMEDIWPQIKAQHPSVILQIVGKGLPAALAHVALKDERIEYLGYVDDIQKVVREATISIVPIRIGSGSRLKILESMALGTPVVTTTVGCEGINALDKQEAVFADTPEEFANSTLALLNNEVECASISNKARTLVEQHYSWNKIGLTATEAIHGSNNAK